LYASLKNDSDDHAVEEMHPPPIELHLDSIPSMGNLNLPEHLGDEVLDFEVTVDDEPQCRKLA